MAFPMNSALKVLPSLLALVGGALPIAPIPEACKADPSGGVRTISYQPDRETLTIFPADGFKPILDALIRLLERATGHSPEVIREDGPRHPGTEHVHSKELPHSHYVTGRAGLQSVLAMFTDMNTRTNKELTEEVLPFYRDYSADPNMPEYIQARYAFLAKQFMEAMFRHSPTERHTLYDPDVFDPRVWYERCVNGHNTNNSMGFSSSDAHSHPDWENEL